MNLDIFDLTTFELVAEVDVGQETAGLAFWKMVGVDCIRPEQVQTMDTYIASQIDCRLRDMNETDEAHAFIRQPSDVHGSLPEGKRADHEPH